MPFVSQEDETAARKIAKANPGTLVEVFDSDSRIIKQTWDNGVTKGVCEQDRPNALGHYASGQVTTEWYTEPV